MIFALIYTAVLAVITLAAVLWTWFFLLATIWGDRRGAPFVRSRPEKIKIMMELAAVGPDARLVDLGSGDGSVLIAAVERGAYATGVEMNPFLVWRSRRRIARRGLQNRIKVVRADLKNYPVAGFDIVTMYLLPRTIAGLREKFIHELKPGARLVSNMFPIQEWQPAKTSGSIYLYVL